VLTLRSPCCRPPDFPSIRRRASAPCYTPPPYCVTHVPGPLFFSTSLTTRLPTILRLDSISGLLRLGLSLVHSRLDRKHQPLRYTPYQLLFVRRSMSVASYEVTPRRPSHRWQFIPRGSSPPFGTGCGLALLEPRTNIYPRIGPPGYRHGTCCGTDNTVSSCPVPGYPNNGSVRTFPSSLSGRLLSVRRCLPHFVCADPLFRRADYV